MLARLLTLSLFFSSISFAQDGNETEIDRINKSAENHLGTDTRDPQDAYEKRLASHLLVTPYTHGLMLFRPSFGKQSAIAVYSKPDKTKKTLNYYLTHTQASDSLWYSMAENNSEGVTRKVDVTRHDLEISADLAIAIQNAWQQMLTKRHPMSYWYFAGLDGTTYLFRVTAPNNKEIKGGIWCPQGPLPVEMVSLANTLGKWAVEQQPISPEQEAAFITRLNTFAQNAKKLRVLTEEDLTLKRNRPDYDPFAPDN